MRILPVTALMAGILLACIVLHAQQAGKITGVITDSSGAAIPDVTVTATNAETGETRRAVTNSTGTYVLTLLPVGDYSLEARKDGFKSAARSGIRIDVNSAPTLNLGLEVGNVTEKVNVTGVAPTIDTESQAIGNSRYEAQLKNLPIIVREVQALVGQTAGVPYGTTDTVGGNFAQGGRSAMQVLADGAQLNPFQTTAWPAIDGIGRRADLTIPGVDAIAEVKWITNGGSAEYAQPTQVIVASKTGTNQLHGSLFEFYRSGGLGARRWEAANRESFVRHQFGGTAGGPIKKDKMFFFVGADVFRH
ncbi:MAG TPA: carboxypeptidase-like regulatory domain-containing protein, partial [Bryobacteraceae bacterium]|nr:carboxypeptidase-like regulatory domain-containing protein [Bryobacteraceae bacterium]